jgi:type II secretory pathway component PulJ
VIGPHETTDAGRPHGYSLVELLVSMTVTMLVMGGLVSALFQSQASHEAQSDRADLRQTSRVALQLIADELRMAGYDIGSAPELLVEARTSTIAFVADVDDGDAAPPCSAAIETAVDAGAERVRYRVQGTDLLRTVDCWDGASWVAEFTDQVVARDVQTAQPLFRYFVEDGTELLPGAGTLSTTDRARVRLVRIALDSLGADNQALGEANVDFQLQTTVRLRNADS